MRNHIQLADAYYRLSDEERKYGESASITNQRTIVREYCEKHGIILVEEFVDDGFSGGNFERPGFQAMLEHLRTPRPTAQTQPSVTASSAALPTVPAAARPCALAAPSTTANGRNIGIWCATT